MRSIRALPSDLVRSIWRVVASTTGTACGFVLLAFGLGRPILHEVVRMADVDAPVDDESAGGATVVARAAIVTARSWRELAAATVRFAAGTAIVLTPLSLMSLPVLLATGIEPTARISSIGAEIAIAGWGPALAVAAIGIVTAPLVPIALRAVVAPVAEVQR